jgi:hypothetical protein
MTTPTFPQITIGTEKQIAFAHELMTRALRRPFCGKGDDFWGVEYCYFDRQMKIWSQYRDDVIASSVSDDLKARALQALEVLPQCSLFWIECGEDTLSRTVEAYVLGKAPGKMRLLAQVYEAVEKAAAM